MFDIFSIINDTAKPLSPKDNLVPCLNLICKNDVTDIVGKPSNFMRNKSNQINKKKPICLNDMVPEFCIASHNEEQLNYEIDTQNFLGKYCEKMNIDKTIFNQISDATGNPPAKVLLTNGALSEVERERGKRNLSLKELSLIISSISCIEGTSHITPDFLRHRISALQYKKKSIIGKKPKNNDLEDFLNSPFNYEKHIFKLSTSSVVKIVDTEKIDKLLSRINELENKISVVCKALSKENSQRLELQQEVKFLQSEYKSVSSQLQEKVKKLVKRTPRNVNKRVIRQKENNKILQEKVDEANCKEDFLEKENEELNKSLNKALRMTLKLIKPVSYLKIKNRKINGENNFESYIQSLKDQILSLENKKCELEGKNEVFTT